MKKFGYQVALLLLLTPLFSFTLSAQQSPRASYNDHELNDVFENYLLRLTRPVININRIPINISFIRDRSTYVGFIIAGHAMKEVCGVATLRVANLLDSMGYEQNTVFSYGVGYDRRGSRDPLNYHQRLKELRNAFMDLQDEYFSEVRVLDVEDSALQNLTSRIVRNTALAFNSFRTNASLNRVIFRYDSTNFPVPVPFYTETGTVSFTVPKSQIGKIPGVRAFDINLFDAALREINEALATNTRAIAKASTYNPTNHVGFKTGRYLVSYFWKGRIRTDSLLLIDPSKVLEIFEAGTHRHIRYYSLTELQRQCDMGVQYLTEKTELTSPISPCEEVEFAQSLIRRLNNRRNVLIRSIEKANLFLENEKNKILQFKTQFSQKLSAGDSLINVDAFLRGWCFPARSAAANQQLAAWYRKREAVWQSVMTRYPAYKKRLPLVKEVNLPAQQIAGVFQAEDVFFFIRDGGTQYVVTPYKMISGKFIQVVDKTNGLSQFFTENNYRLLKL